jgi:hypothetical protein
VYAVDDDAWDVERCDFEAYQRTRDPSHLRAHDGERAMAFVIGPISDSAKRDIQIESARGAGDGSPSLAGWGTAYQFALLNHSLIRIEDVPFCDDAGAVVYETLSGADALDIISGPGIEDVRKRNDIARHIRELFMPSATVELEHDVEKPLRRVS